jgi:hypothetical protein
VPLPPAMITGMILLVKKVSGLLRPIVEVGS